MHPLLIWGGIALIGYLVNEQKRALQAEADRERLKMNGVGTRQRKLVADARGRARRLTVAATKKQIGIAKTERRAAAQARDRLPWGSQAREQAHQIVVTLSRRIDGLYARKRKLQGNTEERTS